MSSTHAIRDDEAETLNGLCEIVNHWATTKGWNEGEDSIQRKSSDIALMHSELSECLEYVRKLSRIVCKLCHSDNVELNFGQYNCANCMTLLQNGQVEHTTAMDDHVPSITGEAAELADVLLRIFHYCGRRNINLGKAVQLKHEYNLSRAYKHNKQI